MRTAAVTSGRAVRRRTTRALERDFSPNLSAHADGDRTYDHRYQLEQSHGPENLHDPDEQRAPGDDLGQAGIGTAPVREEIPPYRSRADTQRAQHAQQRSDADQVAAEAHLRTPNEDELRAVRTNISATPANNQSSAQFSR